MIGVGMREEEPGNTGRVDAIAPDFLDDAVAFQPTTGIDQDRFTSIGDQENMAVEFMREIEPLATTPGKVDVIREFHDRDDSFPKLRAMAS